MIDDDLVLVVAPTALGRAGWLVDAAARRGLRVGVPQDAPRHCYYGGPLYADRAGGALRAGLLEPSDDWLPCLRREHLLRAVHLTKLGRVRRSSGPFFAKPPSGKEFAARVYADGAELAAAIGDLPPETPVLVSDVVRFAAEFRLFLLDGLVHTGSQYATWGLLDPRPLDGHPDRGRVTGFAEELAEGLPSAVVLDVGLLGPPEEPRADIAVVEANMAWFAQPYRSDPDLVLDVVLRAAGPLGEVADADRRFLRAR